MTTASAPNWYKGYVPLTDEWLSLWHGKADFAFDTTAHTVTRDLPDRFADWLNVRDFGAKIDGLTLDTAAFNAALNAATNDTTIYVPHGSGATNLTWAGITDGPTGQVHWVIDGVASGNPIVQINRPNSGDLVENFHNGTKYFCVESAKPDQYGVIRIDYGFDQAGGSPAAIATALRVNAIDNAGAVTSMWGVHVAMSSFSNQAGWPQNVGVSSSLLKYGSAWTAGMHITASDMQNKPSSTGGTLLGMEIGHHADGADDSFNGGVWGTSGTRQGLGIRQSAQQTNYGEFSVAIIAGNDGSNALTRSVYAIPLNCKTYQAFDARGAVAPISYSDPVAGLRMQAGQIIDFNGGIAQNSGAGNYLQYITSGTPRLRYMDGQSELWALSDAGVWSGSSVGTAIGQIPVFQDFQGSGFASLGFPTRCILYKSGTTSDNDFATLQIQRTTAYSGGGIGKIVTNLRIGTTVGSSVSASEWALLAQCSTSSTAAGAQAVGGDFQAIRTGNSTSGAWGAILNVIDQTNGSSSAFPGGISATEIDVRASDADDGLNGAKFGSYGLRQNIQMQIVRNSAATDLEVSTGMWFTANEATHNTYLQAIGCMIGVQMYQLLDSRGAVTPASYTDPMAAVRLSAGHIVDFNGGTTLKSNAGNYLQYTTTGGNRLRYMIGTTERFNIPDTKPTVSGSRGGNAAVAALLTSLANLGLIIDGTSA